MNLKNKYFLNHIRYGIIVFLIVLISCQNEDVPHVEWSKYLYSNKPIDKRDLPKKIILVDDKSYAPLAFIDNNGENRGITIDIWKLWSKKTGIPIEFQLMDWNKALDAVKSGEADAIAGIFHLPERDSFFTFTDAYFTIETGLYFAKDIHGIQKVEDLDGFKVGVVEGDGSVEFVKQKCPNANLIYFPGVENIVKAARKGLIKVFVADIDAANYYLSKFDEGDEIVIADKEVARTNQHVAVKKGNFKLAKIIQIGFSHITEQEKKDIVTNWGGSEIEKRLPLTIILIIAGVLILVLTILFIWNLQLNRRISKATALLVNQNEELKSSEEKFAKMFKESPYPVMLIDLRDGSFVDINQATLNSLEYSSEEIIGKNPIPLGIVDENSESLIRHSVEKGGYYTDIEISVRTKSGKLRYGLASGHIIEVKGIPFIIQTIKDITEQKIVNEALRESEFKFQEMANLLPQVIYESDLLGNLTYVNNQAFEIFGYTTEDFEKGISIMQTIVPEDLDRVKENIGKLLKGNSNNGNEYIGLRKDGTTFPIILFSNLIYRNGKPDGLRGLIIDITERKKSEELLQEQNQVLETQYEEYMQLNEILRQTNYELELAKEKAEESDQLKSAFLANMSHEIRTPMNAIIGFSSIMKDANLPENKRSDYLDIIIRSGKHLMELINSIIDISKIDAGHIQVIIEKTDIKKLMKVMYDFFNLQLTELHKSNISISMHLPSEDINIYTDETRLRQILTNLINNAIKFTESGSVEFGFEIQIDKLQFFVKDTGIGIPPEKLDLIFDRFIQATDSTEKFYGGTGLGLAITKALVELLGGNIRVESQEGLGSTFYFYLPIAPKEEE